MSAPQNPPHALYRFHNLAGSLLYIGRSSNPGNRWGQHSKDKPWWIEVATVQVEPFPNLESVKIAERRAIETEHPKYNVQYARSVDSVPVPTTTDEGIALLTGAFVAISLHTGECNLGTITDFSLLDGEYITLNLYIPRLRVFGGIEENYSINDVAEVKYAPMVSSSEVHEGHGQVVFDSSGLGYDIFDVAPLARFQAQWRFRHGLITADQFREAYSTFAERVKAS